MQLTVACNLQKQDYFSIADLKRLLSYNDAKYYNDVVLVSFFG